jgi:hypothetical protein
MELLNLFNVSPSTIDFICGGTCLLEVCYYMVLYCQYSGPITKRYFHSNDNLFFSHLLRIFFMMC